MKKSEERKNDNLWSAKVKELAGNKCEVCGAEGRLNSHHVYGRRMRVLRWDVRNGVCLCVAHHYEAHHKPLKFDMFIVKKRGEEWAEYLADREKLQYKDPQFQLEELPKLLEEIRGV